MNLIDRAKNIVLTPKTEWETISSEQLSTGQLYKGYVLPLAGIGPIASFIGLSLVGVSLPLMGHYRMPFLSGLSTAVVSYIFALIGVYLVALIINALAPTFGGEKNQERALKVAVYASTPAWIAGALYILPGLSVLALLASLYGLYLLYVGLPVLMKSPTEKAVGYTAVVVICAFVLFAIMGALTATIGGGAGMAAMGMNAKSDAQSGAPASENGLDKLTQLSAKIESAGKKMEAAQKSGDVQAQAAAASEAMGTIMTGGAEIEPVDQNVLKDMLPDAIAGLTRTKLEAEKSGMGGMGLTTATGGYGDDQGRSIDITITDMGGAAMLGAAAAWAAFEHEKETETGYEKMEKINGRPVREKFTKDGSQSEYGSLIGGRFLVEARGQKVDMGTLRNTVGSLDLNKLESMKNEGVKQ
jgi:hypothetical protein